MARLRQGSSQRLSIQVRHLELQLEAEFADRSFGEVRRFFEPPLPKRDDPANSQPVKGSMARVFYRG